MDNEPQFEKYVYDFEVKITDPLQAQATNLAIGWMETTDDGLQTMDQLEPGEEVKHALDKLLREFLTENSHRLGAELQSSVILRRERDEDGNYKSVRLP